MKKIWLLKVLGICLFVCVNIFLFTTYLQAATPTYIELEFSDIDYDEAQYIKFIIDADINFDIVLYMKDNDNNTFRVQYQTENDIDTGDYKDDDDDNDELSIFLDEDEYVTGHDETFNSFTHGNSFSLDEYINTHWQKREYNGGSAKLEKIRIYGHEFKLHYIAIDDDGDFDDPTWELDVSDENWDNLDDFENDGHSLPDLDEYSTHTTDIAFRGDYIHITIDYLPGVGYLPSPYWNQPYNYGWNQPYFGGYQQPYQQPYSPSGWNQQYNYSGSPNYYPDRYGVPVNPQNPYGPYTILPTSYSGYYGNPYNPSNPLYGTVPRPNLSLPSEIMNMMLSSNYETGQRGYELSLPYFQADMMSGWTPWNFPSGSQPYNGYSGGYPPVSPSWPPIGMAYNPLSGSFYIPGQDNPGEYPWGY